MKEEHLKTYNPENIHQIVNQYGNPDPQFIVTNQEHDNRCFIVFNVQEFSHFPVICSKDAKKLKTAAFYIRTTTPESKKVDNPSEMKSIIDLAVDKEIESYWRRRSIEYKYKKGLTDFEKFDKEIED